MTCVVSSHFCGFLSGVLDDGILYSKLVNDKNEKVHVK